MLASVYSYRVMVKSISSCCVRGRWVLSNPVTYVEGGLNQSIKISEVSMHSMLNLGGLGDAHQEKY